MKKILLLIAVVTGLTVNAQTEKGNWIISGGTSVSFASTSLTLELDGQEISDDEKVSVFTLSPSVGYFVMDNLSIGLDLAFSSTKTEDDTTEVTTSSFLSALSGTYYFNAGNNLKPFLGVGAGYISTSSGDSDVLKSSGLALLGKGGVAYFINNSISADFFVQYLNTNQKNKENSDLESKNSGLGLGLGFSLYL